MTTEIRPRPLATVRMGRQAIILLTFLTVTGGLSPARALTVTVGPACGGIGFQGTAREGDAVVKFKSCASDDFCYVRVWKASGEPMTEMLHDDSNLRLWIAGVELSKDMSEERADQMEKAFELLQAEWDTVRCLYKAIHDLGLEEYRDALMCFLGHGQAYEGSVERACAPLVLDN